MYARLEKMSCAEDKSSVQDFQILEKISFFKILQLLSVELRDKQDLKTFYYFAIKL